MPVQHRKLKIKLPETLKTLKTMEGPEATEVLDYIFIVAISNEMHPGIVWLAISSFTILM